MKKNRKAAKPIAMLIRFYKKERKGIDGAGRAYGWSGARFVRYAVRKELGLKETNL